MMRKYPGGRGIGTSFVHVVKSHSDFRMFKVKCGKELSVDEEDGKTFLRTRPRGYGGGGFFMKFYSFTMDWFEHFAQ